MTQIDAPRPHLWVQQIVVQKNRGTHHDVVLAVAAASLFAHRFSADEPNWGVWLDSAFTKTVRRGSAAEVAKVAEWSAASATAGETTAYAFVPMSRDDLDAWPEMKRLRVADFDRPMAMVEWPKAPDGPTLLLNDNLNMSTGKVAAQVAHGFWLHYLRLSPGEQDAWVEAGLPVSIVEVGASDLEVQAATEGAVAVRDAGLTEIEPGSLTVVALPA